MTAPAGYLAEPMMAAPAASAPPGYAYGAAPPGYGTAPPGYGSGYAPGQMVMTGMPVAVVPAAIVPGGAIMASGAPGAHYENSLDVLARARGMYIKEKVRILEVLTDFQQENTFKGFLWEPTAGPVDQPKMGKGAEVFTLKEVSSCCQRQFCGRLRAFDIAMVPSTPLTRTFHPGLENRDSMFGHPDALIMNRPFRCTTCCFNRPKLFMRHNTLGRFATVVNPCTVCSYQFDIYGASSTDEGEQYGLGPASPHVAASAGQKWYTVNGTMCQPAVFCFCPCGECSRVRMQIYEGSDVALERPIGEVARVFPGCLAAAATEADDFTIAFPPPPAGVMTQEQTLKRASLVSSVILMNYLFYERKRRRHDREGGFGVGGDM